jgi:hypothetical protein
VEAQRADSNIAELTEELREARATLPSLSSTNDRITGGVGAGENIDLQFSISRLVSEMDHWDIPRESVKIGLQSISQTAPAVLEAGRLQEADADDSLLRPLLEALDRAVAATAGIAQLRQEVERLTRLRWITRKRGMTRLNFLSLIREFEWDAR